MKLISTAPLERPQETHAWHAQKLTRDDLKSLDSKKYATVGGNEHSYFKTGSGALFHIPLIGGWRDYIVLEIQINISPWYVGWIIRDSDTRKILRSEVHKLPLYEKSVRLLTGTKERSVIFFGVDGNGEQLPVRVVGKGRIGDGSIFGKVRLF